MDSSFWTLVGMVAVAIILAFWRGRLPLLLSGFKDGGLTLKSMWFRLILGFTLGGFIQVLIPGHLIAEWLGPASGLKGILIGSYAGIIMTGGPFIILPVLASIYAAGAGPGPIIALLTSMSTLSLPTILTWEIPFLGAKIAVTRYIVCLLVPPLVGIVGAGVFQLLTVG